MKPLHFAVSAALCAAALTCGVPPMAQTASIRVEGAAPGIKLNPRMYGIFAEEINHGVDGGLYAEMVANRAFEESRPPEGFTLRDGRWKDAGGHDAGYGFAEGEVPNWSLVRQGQAEGSMRLLRSGGLNAKTPTCLEVSARTTSGGRVGVANSGWWGMGVRPGALYDLKLYLRGAGSPGLSVRLEDASGRACSTAATLAGGGAAWSVRKAALKGLRAEAVARLVITLAKPGTVTLDFVSLFPRNTWKGRPNGLRPDIAQMIADLKPGFVRFPGGCVVEGGTVETAYNWKLTVGPPEQRQEQWGAWGYRRTHGLGLYEYFQFCEDLRAAPLWVGFVGQSCIFRQMENVPMDQMGWVRDGFLDIMQYANGPAAGKWGALRAAAGHAKPFGLGMMEIGNENAGKEYEERYRLVHDAVKKADPKMVCLADTSFYAMPPSLFDMNDEHYYNSPQWFMGQFNHYDSRDRKRPPAYLGEVAVTSGEGGDLKGNLLAALGEGVFLLGCERNGDVVRQVSYAPLLAHVEGRSGWHGMIYHDSTRVFGTASYHLWKMLGTNVPTASLPTRVAYAPGDEKPISGRIGLGTWDTSAEFADIRVERGGAALPLPAPGAGWRTEGGQWTGADGVYRQAVVGTGFAYAGDEGWSDTTLSLRARKLGGAEGFLIAFGHAGADQYWWNIGGWDNKEHGIEFNRTPVGRRVPGSIETGRWYDIRIELAGRRIRCYLDGKLIHDETAPSLSRFFAEAGRDSVRGEVVVKAINTGDRPLRADIDLRGVAPVGSTARVETLTSGNLTDNNSFEAPLKVSPRVSTVPVSGPRFAYTFAPRSLTLLRVKVRQAPMPF